MVSPVFETLPLPRPDRPVTWPIVESNPPIADGLEPEQNATLKLYNWQAYINQDVLNEFGKLHNCQVQVSTFNTADEALAKLSSGSVDYDIFFPTVDQVSALVAAGIVRPLNHSYLPNISQSWKEFTNPFYDQQWRYTTPYTIYTTGVAWRKDHVKEDPYTWDNGWAFPWQGQYRGRVGVLDDTREGIALGLLKNGITDLNTESSEHIGKATDSFLELNSLVGTHYDNNDYSTIPEGQDWIHHAWSGDIASCNQYLPTNTSIDTVGYWFPPNGVGPVNNDAMTVLAGGKNPVLAHMLINYLLDLDVAVKNMSYTGYQQPNVKMTSDLLVSQGLVPANLTSTVVRESDFIHGLREMALRPEVDAAWQEAWLHITGGI